MKTTRILVLFIISLNLSCDYKVTVNNDKDENAITINGEGELITRNIDLDSFTKIELIGQAKINIVKGNTQSVKISAQENIIDVMSYTVSDEILKIGIKENYNIKTNKSIFIDIVTPSDITDATITGAGKITILNDKQDYFNIIIAGAGNINLFGLEVDNCNIDIKGAGNCNVYVNNKLNVSIDGVGNVNYKGHPNLTKKISGLGKVTDAN